MLALLLDTSLPEADAPQWEIMADIHILWLLAGGCARITVAGQWRILTALPEHSLAGQDEVEQPTEVSGRNLYGTTKSRAKS